ncbi:MAG TPA: ABC transporter permease [Natronosporangium sp.]
MRILARLRAHAGLWLLTALLGAAMVLVAAAAGPLSRDNEDRALRHELGRSPTTVRDITISEPLEANPTTADAFRTEVDGLLPAELSEVVGTTWGIQRTQIRAPGGSFPGWSASVTGDGVNTELSASMPLASLHHHTGLMNDVTIVEGRAPATIPVRDPFETVIEVMTTAQVADALGLRVGQTYHLLPGVAARAPFPAEEAGYAIAIELVGIFEPVDPAAPVWEFDPYLLTEGTIYWVFPDGSITPLRRATLATDQAAMEVVESTGLIGTATSLTTLGPSFAPESVVRIRLADERVSAAGLDELRAAVAALATHPDRRASMEVETRLIELIDRYERQAAAARALVAVVVAGLIGVGVGLLVLAARLSLDRRRNEVALLRARGGSAPVLMGRFLAEALVAVLPAIAVGWLLHLLIVRARDPDAPLLVEPVPLAVAAVALLAVPVMLLLDLRRHAGLVANRNELRGYRPRPARITVEVAAVGLAVLGVLLLHRRGLNLVGGTDPYLSAVPVLVAVAAGLVALRLYAPPLRAFGAMAARGRGAVGFLGLARAGRAAPVTALPLLVLVLAVAVGGFAGGVYASVAAARDAAAVQALGADARLAGDGLTDEAVAAVSAVPGVRMVAPANTDGLVRVGGSSVQGVFVVTVDTVAYQEILEQIGASARLPEPVVSARPGGGPLPILADRQIAERADGPTASESLTVEIGFDAYEAVVAGDVDELPSLVPGERWVLVPRQALPTAPPVDELLIGGSDVDAEALRAAVPGASVTVTTLAQRRAELEDTGFNRGLTIVFVTGAVGAAVGGVLAVALALVVQVAARSHSISLLRTMGLSMRQARGLLLIELTPVTTLAVVAGAATGIALPVLLAPALGLTEFTGGAPIEIGLDPRTVGLLAGLLGVFVIGGALIEAAVNRRLGLGRVLRVE